MSGEFGINVVKEMKVETLINAPEMKEDQPKAQQTPTPPKGETLESWLKSNGFESIIDKITALASDLNDLKFIQEGDLTGNYHCKNISLQI